MAAARRMADLLAGGTGRDLVLAVISGGGSALLALAGRGDQPGRPPGDDRPAAPQRRDDRRDERRAQAPVAGQRGRPGPAGGAQPGDRPDPVGRGGRSAGCDRFRPDGARSHDLCRRLGGAGAVRPGRSRCPAPVRERLQAGRAGRRCPRRPSRAIPCSSRVQNVIVGSNRLAAEAAVEEARHLGLNALLLSTFVEGEARQVARVAAGAGPRAGEL